jgi:ornithine carbamoyltransferase
LKASEQLKDDWEYNEGVEKLTNNAWYMHCLPADISGENCVHGEVSKEVFARNRVSMYNEASRKPFVIAAMIVLTRLQNVNGALNHLLKSGKRTNF